MAQKTKSNSRRRAAQQPARSRKTDGGVMDRVERALPSTLGRRLSSVRTDLRAIEKQLQRNHVRSLEKQIQRNQRRYARRLNDTVQQAQRRVLRLWVARDRRARRLKLRARCDAVRVLKRLERSLEPPKPRRKASGAVRHKAQAAESRPRSSAATPAARDGAAGS